ncbi:MAG: Protein jag [Parcubacteria group bacterium GW2011_GWA2_33_14]|uniref:R3H domain-containing protein n=1 Tax=Candidatus Staskawiczbacteria bacterium RIFCSPHIGHO2_02_FULL_33_16 TaxID=1802204 RepID=A0A1G2HTI9_9BACT|nr:MAG: Protein jag [Parcubacteria group bacterium GW2011_GWA2_33_14]OGZ65763.1 MAG: hypothetical protein A3D34_02285 [Candidatus Staskawiczbacteria bacterium RIFCSPHIGHO2_02_FULL_33_16]OGZ70867.1 MAG: hypothetical protein A2980_02460 [Candidatus Staskawiczbacteria bacterium RIFCSPLOWO2_01_FULL_33_13]
MEEQDLVIIKKTIEELFEKMTVVVSSLELKQSSQEKKTENFDSLNSINETVLPLQSEPREIIHININLEEPQFLIGQNGQTLFELERIVKIILNKKIQKFFYLNLDINNYKDKKVEYLKNLARDSANEVALTKQEKALSPMLAYERRIIHTELAQRQDVITRSQGNGENRCVVICPR